MGLRQVGEHLVVFMESGLYRLYVPSTDPRNFVLKESEENFGCVSSKSIVQVGNFVFFASKDNIYAMTSSYEVVPCSKSIRDIWQAATNKQLTHGIYDPIKHRVLYVLVMMKAMFMHWTQRSLCRVVKRYGIAMILRTQITN